MPCYLYKCAVDDTYITELQNPAMKVPKPRRKPSTRRGLPDEQIAELVKVASETGDDPALDALMLRFHIETACRRGGLLNLLPKDLDPRSGLVFLREKAETFRWQLVSPTLMVYLLAHVESRKADDGSPVFRHPNGKPISKRRYDYIWERLGEHLSWVATQGVTAHWLRHTTLTWVERNFGHAVARAYAGHASPGDGGSTADYVKATLEEVATALAELTEEDHPFPDGVGGQQFFGKNVPAGAPDWLPTVRLPSTGSRGSGATVRYPLFEELPALVWAANLAALELHVPQWTVEPGPARGLPDRLVFDLDPGDGATIVHCARVAQRLRSVLVADGLTPMVKTSGSKGMQVYAGVRVARPEATSVYAKAVAERLTRETPDLVVSTMTKARRVGRVLIDRSQNNPAKTTVAPSLRNLELRVQVSNAVVDTEFASPELAGNGGYGSSGTRIPRSLRSRWGGGRGT